MNFSLDLDINSLLIISLIFNMVLLVRYVILGPRPPRSTKEVASSLNGICKYLNADLIALQNPNSSQSVFIISPPGLTKNIVKSFQGQGAKELDSEK